MAPTLAQRYEQVSADIAAAATETGRDPGEITTIVVTKFHPASLVRELSALGVRDVGENRHQEAHEKARELDDLDLRWHFVGQLQANKAVAALEYASVIHSLDRDSLLASVAKALTPVDVFIQVNLTDDPVRGGIVPAKIEEFANRVLEVPTITLRGLMGVAPLGEDPRRAFAQLRAYSEALAQIAHSATDLSMGMSGDYREAIAEGATHLRIGTAITGNRPAPG
jgi:PLP dependent protein